MLANDPDASLHGYIWKKRIDEHGDVFFCYALTTSLIFALKIGMNRTGILSLCSGCNSSRFSGPCTLSCLKGITKKDIPMLFCI
jgi:hypothetical protein